MNTAQASAENASWHAVCAADPSVMSRDELTTFYEHVQRVRSVCDAREVSGVRRGRELAAAGRAEPPEAVLVRETARSSRDAEVAARRETACDAVPAFSAALDGGEMSARHIDAAAVAMRGLDDDVAAEFALLGPELVRRASKLGVDAFGRECRDLARHLRSAATTNADVDELERQRKASAVKRWVDKHTGMHNTLLSLDPLRDSKMWTVLNAEIASHRRRNQRDNVRGVSWNELQAEAVFTAITGAAGESHGGSDNGRSDDGRRVDDGRRGDGGGNDAGPADGDGNGIGTGNGNDGPSPARMPRARNAADRVPEIGVLIDWARLVSDAATSGVCETIDGVPLPVATVRRMCCDAVVYPVVLGSDGEVLDQGRATRTANRSQRRALAAMHRGCAYPECTVTFDACRIHHVRWWWRDLGPSDLDNLLPVCERHHHLVHEGGWSLTMTADRVASWVRPDGVVHHRGSTIDRQVDRPDGCSHDDCTPDGCSHDDRSPDGCSHDDRSPDGCSHDDCTPDFVPRLC